MTIQIFRQKKEDLYSRFNEKIERGLLMQSIINEIIEIINTNDTLLDIVVTLDYYLNSLWSELLSKAFERIDFELIAQLKDQGYEIDRVEKRTVQFTFGPVELKRRRLRQKGKKSFIPLNKKLGLNKYKRYSPLVEMKASVLATDLVYRKAADTMSLLTPLTISHGLFIPLFNA